MPFFQLENLTGDAVIAGGKKITPISQAIKLQFPGNSGGLIWNRPISILVQSGDGTERTFPVRDVTRIYQLMLYGLAFFSMILLAMFIRKRN